jgi:hypothetical protein
MAWTIFAVTMAIGLVAESYRRLREVSSLSRRVSRELHAGPRPGGGTGELGSKEERARVAELNEASIDIRSGLALASIVPRSCAKAALSIGALSAIVQSAALLGGREGELFIAPAVSFVSGCVGALGCTVLGRAAEGRARRLRGEWATLIRRSARDVPS